MLAQASGYIFRLASLLALAALVLILDAKEHSRGSRLWAVALIVAFCLESLSFVLAFVWSSPLLVPLLASCAYLTNMAMLDSVLAFRKGVRLHAAFYLGAVPILFLLTPLPNDVLTGANGGLLTGLGYIPLMVAAALLWFSPGELRQCPAGRWLLGMGLSLLAFWMPLSRFFESRPSSESYWAGTGLIIIATLGVFVVWVDTIGEKVKRTEGRLSRIVEGAFDAIIYLREGRIIYANKAFLKLFGYKRVEMVAGREFSDFLVADDQKRMQEWSRMRDKGETVPSLCELRALTAGGEEVFLEVAFSSVEDQQGIIRQATIRDLTQRRGLEKRLLVSQKMEALGRLAGGIAHDVNNLLTAILGFASHARDRSKENKPIASELEAVIKASRRGSAITRNLLGIARSNSRSIEVVEAAPIIREVVDIIRYSSHSNIKVKLDLQPETSFVRVDPAQFHLAILNLCINALEAMENGDGSLTVSMRQVELPKDAPGLPPAGNLSPGRYALISVADTGHGIPPGHIDKVAEPFFTTKQDSGGTGLGLTMAVSEMERYSGLLRINSSPGEGTEVELFLPLAQAPEQSKETSAPPATRERVRGRILVVDDDPLVRKLATTILESKGHSVLCATNGKQGLEVLESHREDVDLVLLDLLMPAMDGQEFVKRMESAGMEIPVIISSGYADEEHLLPEGGNIIGVLSKPYESRDLLEVVEKTVSRSD